MCNDFMRLQLESVLPSQPIEHMFAVDVQQMTRDAFEFIGYLPLDIDEAFEKTWRESSPEDSVVEFAYNTWRNDKGG